MDVILVDTAGRSQNDRLRLNQLRSFLAACRADEVHLVVSATANRRCARNVLAQFGPLGANRIILTKLDEAETFGMILNLSADGAAAVSYVTTGQDVPDDIELSDAQSLAKRIVGD
jgi:flagellar biosynthesis protein FlhF